MMKEERMAVLGMLEKGIITVAEAERLLMILQTEADERMNIDGVGAAIGSAINKAGDVLGTFAKSVGETAEKTAVKVEPKIKKAASTLADKAAILAEDVKNFAERKKQEFEEMEKEEKEEELFSQDAEEPLEQKEQEAEDEKWKEADEKFGKKMNAYLNSVKNQAEQLDSEEAFLKSMGLEEEDNTEEEKK